MSGWGGGIIDLHHEPTLERVFELNTRYVAGIWTKYPLQSINVTFSHATISAAGINCKMDVEYLVRENGVKS